eukprot:2294518-Rhodomonas_salina.2
MRLTGGPGAKTALAQLSLTATGIIVLHKQTLLRQFSKSSTIFKNSSGLTQSTEILNLCYIPPG